MTTTSMHLAPPGRTRQWALRVLRLPPAYVATLALLLLAAWLRPQLLSLPLLLLILRQAAPLASRSRWPSATIRRASPPIVACAAASRARASSMIVTLAMAMILTGIVIALSQQRAPGQAPELLRELALLRLGGIPLPVLGWLAALVPVALWLRYSVYGRYLDAVGANPKAAALSGIPYLRVIFLAHVSSALISVGCGFILVGFVGVGSTTLGQDLALNSLAAVILGGVNFGNGRGGMAGPAVAAFMLTFLFNFLTSLGLGEPGRLMLQGAIIAVAALAYSLGKRQTG